MKKIDFKNFKNISAKTKKILWWVLGVLILALLVFLFYKALDGKSIRLLGDKDEAKLVDIANSKDYSKFEGKVSSFFEGTHTLDFSFLYKNDFKALQGKGDQAKWFKLIDTENNNYVTLYFTYEGGRGYSADEYIENVFKKANEEIKVEDVKFADGENGEVKYILDEKANTEYYIESIKQEGKDPWLAIVENKKADNEIYKTSAKDLMRSLEIK